MSCVTGLSGGYTKAPILRDVDLAIGPAEIVACFGRNGAGKTTLLRALSGSLAVCSGSVTLGDTRTDGAQTGTRAQLGMAHVPEGRHIFKAMTVEENLEVGALATRGRGRRVRPPALSEIYDL